MSVISYRFFQSMWWSAIESGLYQVLYIIHQAALYAWCPAHLYGASGILFSALFTTIGLCNFGFDLLLAPHSKSWSQSKKDFISFFSYHIPTTLLGVVLIIVFTGIWWGSSHHTIWIILSTILLLESSRKVLKNMLRLVSYNKEVAFIEVITFISYMAMMWTWYWYSKQFSLIGIFLPLVIAGICSMLVLLIYATRWYATLPNAAQAPTQVPSIGARTPLLTHQITSTLLSPNILVLLCSLRLDVAQIGSIKLLSTFIQSITQILNKIFGISTAVLFSMQHINPTLNTIPTEQLVSTMLNTGLTILAVISCAALGGCCLIGVPIGAVTLIALFLSIVTCYLATYEQLFISHTKVNYLLVANSATLILLIMVSKIAQGVSASFIMGMFLLLRVITALVLSHIAFAYWKVSLHSVHKAILAGGLVATILLLLKIFIQ